MGESSKKPKTLLEKLKPSNLYTHLHWRVQHHAGDLADPDNTFGAKILEVFQRIRSVPAYFHLRATLTNLESTGAEDTPENWHFNMKSGRAVRPEELIERHPTIVFSGDGQLRDGEDLKKAIQDVERIEKSAPVIAYGYHTTDGDKEKSRRAADAETVRLSADPDFYNKEAQYFTEKFLLPKVFASVGTNSDSSLKRDEKGRVQVSGKIEPETLAKNLRLTMLGYSYGGAFIRMTMNALKDYMLDNGYSKQEAHEGMRNIFVRTMGSGHPIRRDEPCATGVCVIDKKDHITLFDMDTQGFYPDAGQERARRINPEDPTVLAINSRQRLYWIDTKESEGTVEGNYRFHHVYNNPKNMPEEVLNAIRYAMVVETPLPELEEMTKFDITKYERPKSYGIDRNGDNILEVDARAAIERLAKARDAIATMHDSILAKGGEDKDAVKAAKQAIREALVEHFGTDDTGKNRLSSNNARKLVDILVYPIAAQFAEEAAKRISPAEIEINGSSLLGRGGWNRGGDPAE